MHSNPPRLHFFENVTKFSVRDTQLLRGLQNAAARLITRVRRCEHITPALRQLHWLPVRRRVDFKISTLVYRSLAGTAPVYRSDESTLVTAAGRRPLRSADNRTCWSRDHATSSVTAVLPPPGQRCRTVCLNSFGNRSHHVRTIQTIVENVYVWFVGPDALCLNVKGAR